MADRSESAASSFHAFVRQGGAGEMHMWEPARQLDYGDEGSSSDTAFRLPTLAPGPYEHTFGQPEVHEELVEHNWSPSSLSENLIPYVLDQPIGAIPALPELADTTISAEWASFDGLGVEQMTSVPNVPAVAIRPERRELVGTVNSNQLTDSGPPLSMPPPAQLPHQGSRDVVTGQPSPAPVIHQHITVTHVTHVNLVVPSSAEMPPIDNHARGRNYAPLVPPPLLPQLPLAPPPLLADLVPLRAFAYRPLPSPNAPFRYPPLPRARAPPRPRQAPPVEQQQRESERTNPVVRNRRPW